MNEANLKRAECGSCIHFHAHPQMIGHGTCCSLPPVPILMTQNGQQGFTNMRPVMNAKDGCSLYRPHPVTAAIQIPPAN